MLSNRPWYVSALFALCAVTLLISFAWLFSYKKNPHGFFGTSYSEPFPSAYAFSGIDNLGKPYTFSPEKYKASIVFFGFLRCPNICPTSLSNLHKLRLSLPKDKQNSLNVVFISVDPDRDTPALMNDYISFFGKSTGLIIKEPKLSETAKAYGVAYQKVLVKNADYQINHTTASYLIDAKGKLRALWDYTQLPQIQKIKSDVMYVMENPS